MKEYRKISHLDIEYSLANLKQLVFEVTDACNLRCNIVPMQTYMRVTIKEKI